MRVESIFLPNTQLQRSYLLKCQTIPNTNTDLFPWISCEKYQFSHSGFHFSGHLLLISHYFSMHWYVVFLTLCSSVTLPPPCCTHTTHTPPSSLLHDPPSPFVFHPSVWSYCHPAPPPPPDCLLFVTFFCSSLSIPYSASHRSYYQSQSAVTV